MAISTADLKFITNLYVGYFNRAPDPAGLQYWINKVDAGRDLSTIAADFAKSAEATALYPYLEAPDVATSTSLLEAVYQNLLNRAPDALGLAHWNSELASGAVSVGDIIDAIIKGATTAPDSVIIDNKAKVALDFAQEAAGTSGFTFDATAKIEAAAVLSGVDATEESVTAAKAATKTFLEDGRTSAEVAAEAAAAEAAAAAAAAEAALVTASVDAAATAATTLATAQADVTAAATANTTAQATDAVALTAVTAAADAAAADAVTAKVAADTAVDTAQAALDAVTDAADVPAAVVALNVAVIAQTAAATAVTDAATAAATAKTNSDAATAADADFATAVTTSEASAAAATDAAAAAKTAADATAGTDDNTAAAEGTAAAGTNAAAQVAVVDDAAAAEAAAVADPANVAAFDAALVAATALLTVAQTATAAATSTAAAATAAVATNATTPTATNLAAAVSAKATADGAATAAITANAAAVNSFNSVVSAAASTLSTTDDASSAALLATATDLSTVVTTAQTANTASGAAINVATVNQTAQTFTLTTGVDAGAAFTGGAGDDTFDAQYKVTDGVGVADIPTLGSLDVIDGGAGNDTLSIINQDGAVTLPAAKISNVEIISIRADGAVTVDTQPASITGVKTIKAEAVAGAVAIDTLSDVTSVEVTGTATTVGIGDAGAAGTDKLTSVSSTGNTGALIVASDVLANLTLASTDQNATVTAAAGTRELNLSLNKVTGGIIEDDEATSLTVKTTGEASAGVTLDAAKATGVTINADEKLTVADMNVDAAKSITVIGDSAVIITAVTTAPVLETVNASDSTGGLTITPTLGTATAFTGGVAADAVTLAASTKAANMGAGDDTVTLTGSKLGTNGSVDGGDGTDTLSMTAANAATASATTTFEASISNFEKLSLGELVAGATNTVNLTNMDDINYVVSAGSADAVAQIDTVTITGIIEAADIFDVTVNGTVFTTTGHNTPAGVSAALAGLVTGVGVTATDATGSFTLEADVEGVAFTTTVLADGTGGGVDNTQAIGVTTTTPNAAIGVLALTNFAANGTVELTEGGITTVSLTDATGDADKVNLLLNNGGKGPLEFGSVTAANVETVSITTKDSGLTTNLAATVDTATLVATSATAVTVSGNNGLILSNVGNTKITTFDASGVVADSGAIIDTAANLGVTFVSDNSTTTAVVTITGGDGNDTLEGHSAKDTINGGAGNDKLSGLAGADILNGGAGNDELIGGAGLDTLTGGAGNDDFVIQAETSLNVYDTIVDFTAGDKISVAALTAFEQTKVDLASTAVFQDYANAVINASALNDSGWFQYDGDTYLVADSGFDTAAFTDTMDVIVKIAGLVDLSNSTVAGAELTFV
jgi:hypothetical protein